MQEHLLKTLEDAKQKLREQEDAVMATKKFINQLCSFADRPPLYSDADLQTESLRSGLGAIRSDTFYGKSAITACREYLEMRRGSGLGAASLAEIMDALETGGFDFTTISADEEGQKRGVAITLAKNSSIFHKLPNGNWGLLAWYPEAKEKKQQRRSDGENGATKIEVVSPKTPVESQAPTQQEGFSVLDRNLNK